MSHCALMCSQILISVLLCVVQYISTHNHSDACGTNKSHHIAKQSKPSAVPGHTHFIALPREKLNVSVDDRHKYEITIQKKAYTNPYSRIKGLCIWFHIALIHRFQEGIWTHSSGHTDKSTVTWNLNDMLTK